MTKSAKAKAEPPKPLRQDPDCRRCPLHESSLTVCCPSTGPTHAEIALWGEALGANEEERGKPFVGDAGRKLNYLLRQVHLKRKMLRVANTVRCRPPGNKTPTKKIIDACWGFSLLDILIGKPKVIVALGAVATKQLLGAPVSVEKVRGFPVQRTFTYEGRKGTIEHTCWVVPTYHPAACLHDWANDDLVVFDLETAKLLAAGHNRLTWPDTKINVAKTLPEALHLIKRLKRAGAWVFDCETTALSPHEAKLMCIGFCMKPGEAHILPFHSQGPKPFWKPAERRRIVAELTEAFEESEVWGQNLKFDVQHIRALTGIIEYDIGYDTLLAHHNIDENKPHNLTFQCQWYLKWAKYDALMDKYKTGKRTFRTWEVPDELLWRYCGYDCDGTFRVKEEQAPELDEANAWTAYNLEKDLIVPIADVEYRGFQVDKAKLLHLSSRYRKQANQMEDRLKKTAISLLGEEFGESFNPNSPQQLAKVLKAAGAPLYKKTKSGNVSVDKFVLAKLVLSKNKAGTIARNVQSLRKATKYLGTYLDGKDGESGLLQHLESYSRVHPNYNLGLTRTGRLSADDPPIQTIPRVGSLRTIFTPDDPANHKLIAVDYEKLELCIMAWLANDEAMCRELINRVDLHTRMAVTVKLGRDPTDREFKEMAPHVGKDERAIAKGVNFGIPYGRGAAAIVEANPDAFPIDMPKNMRIKIVQDMIEAYYEKYWGVYEYMEDQIREAHRKGYLVTPFFKRERNFRSGMRWFDSDEALATDHREFDLSHLDREARNYRIQSIGSDLLSRATKRAWDGMNKIKLPAMRIVLSLHDALVFNIHQDYVDEALYHIPRWMETRLPKNKKHKYEMPIRVEALVQDYWGQEYEEAA